MSHVSSFSLLLILFISFFLTLSHTQQAAEIDSSDVTLWYHIGLVAMKIPSLGLARKVRVRSRLHVASRW
jgi:hypothetical protein